MKIQVIHGEHAREITINVNEWLEANVGRKGVVVTRISDALPCSAGNGGGYVTIVYEENPDEVFGKEMQ